MYSMRWLAPKLKPSKEMVILITGCDTGLGFSMACEAISSGFTVVAGLFKGTDSQEALKLKKACGDHGNSLHLVEMDVTKEDSVKHVSTFLENILNCNQNYYLHSVVNNAGVMVFGEAEWLTTKLMRNQLDVNLYGPMLVYSHTNHLLRKSRMRGHFPRLVITNSHCSIQPLPGLATYAATKCGLVGWEEALRMEISKYGISVVRFIPGSMVLNTNILSNQNIHSEEMKKKFSDEQEEFYGEYFDRFTNYLSVVSTVSSGNLTDKVLMKKFVDTLIDKHPFFVYKHEPSRYKIYHFLFGLFKYAPFQIHEKLVSMFMRMPKYSKN